MPVNPNYSAQGLVARFLKNMAAAIDGQQSNPLGPRMNGYNEQGMFISDHGEPLFADEGSLFMASMGPSATALQLGLSATFSATAAAIVIKNNAPVGSPIRTKLREIHFLCAVPPTAGTSLLYATVIDNVNRNPTTLSSGSGGTGPGTPATVTAYLAQLNAATYSGGLPVSQVFLPLSTAAGAPPTVPAASAGARVIVGNGNLRSVIPVGAATSGVQDDFRIEFGAQDKATGGATRSTAAASQIIEPHPAVSLGAQETFLLYLWAPSNITAGLAFAGLDVSLVER